ncbi:MAG: alpha-L-fucosidase [Tannerellaceae bacterium]|nr:alpha-L-fucosidase [Tannerellaceae bacterium]
MRKSLSTLLLLLALSTASATDLQKMQQAFVDLKFGMFIHFNIPTFTNHDWPDPEADPAIFNPRLLDCNQWAEAAKSAKMRYGCLTAKHHSGFCIWDTQTTDYGVMNSPLRRDVVREYADAFRRAGLRVMLYYSILDTHHSLRPGFINRHHIDMVKAQISELLSNYGHIDALIIDGWDAPWSRISYEDIPFEEIYNLVKSLQPQCLLMDLNAAKYPPEMLFYTDIKSYEQGAGQHIAREANRLPALSCLPIQKNWFWKPAFPTDTVKSPLRLVRHNLEAFNRAYCNFILNVAPNRDGLIDPNALQALAEIGRLWDDGAPSTPLPPADSPIISTNLAKHQPVRSSWSDDMMIMDFGNDDSFRTSWESNPEVSEPWFEIDFPAYQTFNAVMVYDSRNCIRRYSILYERNSQWIPLADNAENDRKVKLHRFDPVRGGKVRIVIHSSTRPPAIAEMGVYNEWRPQP